MIEQGVVEVGFAFTQDAMRKALRELLLQSGRVRRSLEKVCIVKRVHLGAEGDMTTYCYDEQRFLAHLVAKHEQIRKHLAERA